MSSEVFEGRNAVGAAAVMAVINGATVIEAYQQQNVALPTVGTEVPDPVAPGALQAGDVGMWTDRMVMALGSGKAMISGHIQPIDSISSGPDFLGWFDPTNSAG